MLEANFLEKLVLSFISCGDDLFGDKKTRMRAISLKFGVVESKIWILSFGFGILGFEILALGFGFWILSFGF